MERRMGKTSKKMLAVTAGFAVLMSACSNAAPNEGAEGAASGEQERTTLKVEVFDRGNAPAGMSIDNNYLTNYVKSSFSDTSGIDVQYVPIPRSEEIQKLNVLMASADDVPDIVFTYDSGTYYRYATQGGLTDVTELLDEYGPNLKAFLGEDTLKYGQIDGQQLAIPGRRLVLGRYASYVRQDWLDKVGLPVPQTTDELYEALKAFKAQDPGGLGDKMIPLGMSMAPAQYESLLWSFVEPLTEEQRYTLTQKLGSSDYPVLLPGFKDGLQFMNKLYNEGLISKDFALDEDKKQIWQDVQNGLVGAYSEDAGELFFGYNSTYKNMQTNVSGATFTPIDPYTDAEGKHAKPGYAPNAMYIMIPKSSERAVEAIKYLDWMASEDHLFFMQNGVEGENYALEDGIPVLDAEAPQDVQDRLYNYGDMAIIVNGKFIGEPQQNSEAYIRQVPKEYHELMRTSVDISNVDKIDQIVMPRPIESESKYGNALAEKYKELIVKTTMAAPDKFESTYESIMKEYMAGGGQAILDERKTVYGEMR
ncbi:putative aldouronate transport system substrate-binding protein [Paenibacillus phyllosphaerae]|uniref:Putative aldouronate transport system substrate-binding protein n=2 Tax=Paenibacillus phyllosphaerae TaxID=274593 RepID=A0A7W5AZR4_9BACL|nr:extracellular solute-binding protein [Paenibacillus phyllosphaerae]MBB3111632.1 putative aldouronate transport system substrate-binding protein [Paenibacillus phyllosphaerae]